MSSSVPVFRDRVAVDVLYEKAAVFSGSALRCSIEVRGPAVNEGTGAESCGYILKFLSFQLVGMVSALRPAVKAALDAAENEIEEQVQQNKSSVERFSALLVEDATRICPTSDWCKISASEKGATQEESNWNLPSICYDPPSDPNSLIFMKSYPILICQDKVFTTPETQIFGFECLIPPFLPPSFAGTVYKYSYYLTVTASSVSNRQSPSLDHVRLPVNILGPASIGMMSHLNQTSPLILDHQFKLHYPSSKNVIHFDFCAHSWAGGSHLCQYFYRPGVASGLGPSLVMSQDSADADPSPNVESETLLWLMTLQPHWQQNDPSWNRSILHPNIQWSGYGPLDNFWCNDEVDISSEVGMPRVQEGFRISHEGHHVVSLQLLGLHPCLTQQPSQLHSKFKKKIPIPNHGLGCPLGNSFVVGFDFSDARLETLEIHAAVVRFEASVQAPLTQFAFPFFSLGAVNGRSTDDPLLHRHTIAEIRESVLHSTRHTIEIKIPVSATPTFETNFVSVAYCLIFTLFCVGTSSESPSNAPWSSSIESLRAKLDRPVIAFKNRDMVELQWTVGLTILPPVSIESDNFVDLPPPSEPLGYFSSTSACWSIGEGYKRLHRGILL